MGDSELPIFALNDLELPIWMTTLGFCGIGKKYLYLALGMGPNFAPWNAKKKACRSNNK
jgi:hypothetical protein